eukprot:scaffold27820_cov177-Skeletonema_menzelii.AAC.1
MAQARIHVATHIKVAKYGDGAILALLCHQVWSSHTMYKRFKTRDFFESSRVISVFTITRAFDKSNVTTGFVIASCVHKNKKDGSLHAAAQAP